MQFAFLFDYPPVACYAHAKSMFTLTTTQYLMKESLPLVSRVMGKGYRQYSMGRCVEFRYPLHHITINTDNIIFELLALNRNGYFENIDVTIIYGQKINDYPLINVENFDRTGYKYVAGKKNRNLPDEAALFIQIKKQIQSIKIGFWKCYKTTILCRTCKRYAPSRKNYGHAMVVKYLCIDNSWYCPRHYPT
jgi:hypothetical protein